MNGDEVTTKWEKNLVPHAIIILVEDVVGLTRRWNVLIVNLNSGRKRKMAKFTEVMRQAKRLCAAHDSMCYYRNCPLDNGNECRMNIDLDGEDYNELERIIMDWAAEHPEPVYPSWEDAWKQIFPNGIDVPCPSEYDAKYGIDCFKFSCKSCKKRPIPAEIAGKLGIRPKED